MTVPAADADCYRQRTGERPVRIVTGRAGDRTIAREAFIEEELAAERHPVASYGIVLRNWKIKIQSQRNGD